jgi:twitching motility protein PilT
VTTPYASEAFLHQILAKAHAAEASDVHLKVGEPPGARVRGDIMYFRADPLGPKDTEAVARLVLAQRTSALSSLAGLREIDVSYEVPNLGRFRVNLYLQRGTYALVMRVIPAKCPTFDELRVPQAVRALADRQRGLVLVVGPSGHGKSWTLAAMMEHIVATHAKHVVTIEDPIEFLHAGGHSSVSQREVGADTDSFAAGVRAAMRQDPNVLMVGDIRDATTMDVVLQAAETGQLVFSSLHTADAERTVGRMLSMSAHPQETRDRLSECLVAIVAQRLLPRADGSGRILATEVLNATMSVRMAIRHPEQNPTLRELMERGGDSQHGMHTFAMDIERLVKAGRVDADVARQAMVF